LKWIFNRAVRHEKLKINPIASVKRLPENNVRQRILTVEEFTALINACDPHLQPIVQTAYYMGIGTEGMLPWTSMNLPLRAHSNERFPFIRGHIKTMFIIRKHPVADIVYVRGKRRLRSLGEALRREKV
jgi:hypothetical protein